jgi:hypothetical protein
MTKLSSLISKNCVQQKTHNYIHTSLVSHRGTPISFAMRDDGKIFYSVLDLSNSKDQPNSAAGEDRHNDKFYWSSVDFNDERISRLQFPMELMQVGYAIVPNYQMSKYDENNEKIIQGFSEDDKPLDKANNELSEKAIEERTDSFFSSTAKLGAKEPFQALSDGKYIYLFRQAISGSDQHNEGKEDQNNDFDPVVDSTLLVDRFILSGTVLKPGREIRYQRSRHKTRPESRKDTLSAVDVEGRPFYEPTRELAFANNLQNGNFTVLLIPGADTEEQRWQIFTSDSVSGKINSFNIRFDPSIVFDTSESENLISEFMAKYALDKSLVTTILNKINAKEDDKTIATAIWNDFNNKSIEVPKDALEEIVYAFRTGVSKDDFILESTSEWPLIEYESDGSSIKAEYLDNGVLKKGYSFKKDTHLLTPRSSAYAVKNGLSASYYYQQEMGPDNKPMKNKACVMLAAGLEDKNTNKYIGVLNFSAAASGRLSHLTTDAVNMPDINVQALDENPYRDLTALNQIAWQQPQKMRLLDIDANGLSTSGGVLKFAYTSANIGISEGYSDAVEATNPYLFDDSLGRVNLYFKGKNQNFFVLYFNPTGSKSVEVRDLRNRVASPPLAMKPRLDRDLTIDLLAVVPNTKNTCTLTMVSQSNNSNVEEWRFLPKRLSHIADLLNGAGSLTMGTLDPLGTADPRAAYTKGNARINIRTSFENDLNFNDNTGYADQLSDGNSHTISIADLSPFLKNNSNIQIANKSFVIDATKDASVRSDLFYKSYLSAFVTQNTDIDNIWNYLRAQKIIKPVSGKPDSANLGLDAITGTYATLENKLTDGDIDNLSLILLSEGNEADLKNRRARLKQSIINILLDVAKMRIITLSVIDTNTQSVDRLEAGLAVNVQYDYAQNFTCTPQNLSGTSAPKWEHKRSFLFNIEVNYSETVKAETRITSNDKYTYAFNNAIGQWEDWEASLALELNGAVLHTNDSTKLDALKPSKKGLSAEAWIKPNNPEPSKIICYQHNDIGYALGIERSTSTKYKCSAFIGNKKYTTENDFHIQESGKNQWRHVAFTHKKYWGYQLTNGESVNCGNDNSLHLNDEFSLEVLAQINKSGTLLKKAGEYHLSVDGNRNLAFTWAGKNRLAGSSNQISAFNKFYKITLICSKNKPQTEPTIQEYPITGNDPVNDSNSKWYQKEDMDTKKLLEGMAEKQDQLDASFEFSKSNLFGAQQEQSNEANPSYYQSIVITDSNNNSVEWTSPEAQKMDNVEAFMDFILGGDGFEGIFTSVRIWNRALSISEAKALTVAENEAGLVSQWRMAEGKGKYLYDNVSENHGVAVGGSWADSPQTNRIGQFQFYVDGSPEKHTATDEASTSTAPQFCIGGEMEGTSKFKQVYKGGIEEIRIWNVPRTNEQITDNAFGRLKGEWEQLIANYTFDKALAQTNNTVQDSSLNSISLKLFEADKLNEVLSTAPIASEIPQVRSALTGVLTAYNSTVKARPGVVEYGDVQKNDDGTMNGILKRCYSFIDKNGVWNRMTGYKVGNLISQWYGQAQFAPQVMGFLEGPPPVPAENFPVGSDRDVRTYAYSLNNSVSFNQAEEVSYNYSTSKEAGWNTAVEGEGTGGLDLKWLVAPFGLGISGNFKASGISKSNWETSGSRSESYERGVTANVDRGLSASLAGFDNGKEGNERYYKLGNTGFALVKSKTADIYLLRLAHNNALVSISWQPNPDIPEDVNIIPFPLNPLYTKQGTLDGKFGESTDDHYPQAHGAYGQYSYFKPREAYKLKKEIEKEKMELKAYFEDSFDVAKTNAHFNAAAATTGLAQLTTFIPGAGIAMASLFNQIAGQMATQIGYNNTNLKEDLANMASQRNLVNTYVWTIEGGFYAESTEVTETQQETYANETSLSLSGGFGLLIKASAAVDIENKSIFSSGSSFTITKSKTKESSTSFGLDVSVDVPTSPRYKYAGVDGRTLTKGLIAPGVVDAYRFMSFYLEPKGKNFTDLFTKVIDPIWLDESSDPNAQALRQARGNISKAKPCWRIMHRVTYVSRILPEFKPEAPPSLEKTMRISGIESNYLLIKKFEPYVANITDSGTFSSKIDEIIDSQLPEFKPYKRQIKNYLALYFNMEQA